MVQGIGRASKSAGVPVGGRIRVAMVTNAYAPRIGGISRYVGDLVRGLRHIGVDCRVFAMPESFNRLDEMCRDRRGWWRTIHLLFVAAFVTHTLIGLLRLRRGDGRLVVHSHSASYCLLVGILSKAFGCLSVHTFPSPIDREPVSLQALAPKAGALVFVSRSIRDSHHFWGVRNWQTELIPTSVDSRIFRPPSPMEKRDARKAVQELFPIDKQQGSIVLFAGRIVPEKGVHVLIDAAIELQKDRRDLRVLIVGPFDSSHQGHAYKAGCEEAIAKAQLTGRVVMTGPIPPDDLLRFYWASDLFVCPSIWLEPAALVVLEAMACGLPVVGSRIGGIPEQVDDGKTGLLVPPNDPAALAKAIVTLLARPVTTDQFSVAARSKVEEEFATKRIVDRYVKLYTRLVGNLT